MQHRISDAINQTTETRITAHVTQYFIACPCCSMYKFGFCLPFHPCVQNHGSKSPISLGAAALTSPMTEKPKVGTKVAFATSCWVVKDVRACPVLNVVSVFVQKLQCQKCRPMNICPEKCRERHPSLSIKVAWEPMLYSNVISSRLMIIHHTTPSSSCLSIFVIVIVHVKNLSKTHSRGRP